jgi:hypothetical protein
MCRYTQVTYGCSHIRYIVREWCTKYETTNKRCPLLVFAVESRYARIRETAARIKTNHTESLHVVIAEIQVAGDWTARRWALWGTGSYME